MSGIQSDHTMVVGLNLQIKSTPAAFAGNGYGLRDQPRADTLLPPFGKDIKFFQVAAFTAMFHAQESTAKGHADQFSVSRCRHQDEPAAEIGNDFLNYLEENCRVGFNLVFLELNVEKFDCGGYLIPANEGNRWRRSSCGG